MTVMKIVEFTDGLKYLHDVIEIYQQTYPTGSDSLTWPQVEEDMIHNPRNYVMAVMDGKVILCVRVEPFRKSAHLHGISDKNLPKRVVFEALNTMYSYLFERFPKVFIQIPTENDFPYTTLKVKGHAMLFGYKFSHRNRAGLWYYLTKYLFVERMLSLGSNQYIAPLNQSPKGDKDGQKVQQGSCEGFVPPGSDAPGGPQNAHETKTLEDEKGMQA